MDKLHVSCKKMTKELVIAMVGLLVLISVGVLMQSGRYKYNIIGRNVGSVDIYDASASFSEFSVSWGILIPFAEKTYAIFDKFRPPTSVRVLWRVGSQKLVHEIKINDVPDTMAGLERIYLRVELDSDTKTAEAFWTTTSYPSRTKRGPGS